MRHFMRKKLVMLFLILLIGCSGLSQECEKECSRYYTDSGSISRLLGIDAGNPKEVICYEPLDCKAVYKIKDKINDKTRDKIKGTSFELYYFRNDSSGEFEKSWNHEVLHTSNCNGKMCSELNEFHYKGEPRELEVVCKNNEVKIQDKNKIKEHNANCTIFKTQNKYVQRTWVCDFNSLIEDSCQ